MQGGQVIQNRSQLGPPALVFEYSVQVSALAPPPHTLTQARAHVSQSQAVLGESEASIRAKRADAYRHRGRRALVAMANFFQDSGNGKDSSNSLNGHIMTDGKARLPLRKGSRLDNLLAQALEEKIDCK